MPRSLIALILAASVSLGGAADAFGHHPGKSAKRKKPKAAPCQTGCKPETSAPNVAADTPADEAAQRELWDLARAMRNGVPGGVREAVGVRGEKHDPASGARAPRWRSIRRQFEKPQPAITRMAAQSAERHAARVRVVLDGAGAARAGAVRGCYKVLQTIQRDYPNTAMREPLLEAFVPTAVLLGHAQEAIDALNAYSCDILEAGGCCSSVGARIRRRINSARCKGLSSYLLQIAVSRRSQAAGSAQSQVMHALGKEYPYPGVEMQEQRAQAFYDAHKWREARTEFENC